eukprot:TRINITY_DN2018_c0_g1_i1.p1 TRINITY_DN2018_c0_g1~~TRINITY_DN2018_c0_g1_i1.p1  ORF type:complete len:241 (-),score=40.98 TRINITY_DN2018_c0_g1_i1:292-1014(-)
MEGFAMEGYVVPRGVDNTVKYGTMSKAPNEAGSLFNEVKRHAKNPGPDRYHKEQKPFGSKAALGNFSKIDRKLGPPPSKGPAVGQYDTNVPQLTPRVRGGPMPKTNRGCIFYDQAKAQGAWKPAPGKYDPKHPEKHLNIPHMTTEVGQSRSPRKPPPLGPGHYSPDHAPTEKRSVYFTGSKDPARSYLDKKTKTDKTPAPGHVGIPEAKNYDRSGCQKHCRVILADKIITPRVNPKSSTV